MLALRKLNTKFWRQRSRASTRVAGSRGTIYQEALKLAPFEAELWLMTGICLRESGRLPDAIQYLEKANMLDDSNLHVDLELGNTLHVVGRFYEEAAKSSRKPASCILAICHWLTISRCHYRQLDD